LLLLATGCAAKHPMPGFLRITTDAEVLDKLHYTGPHRAVYRIGEQKCYTNRDDLAFPQADLKCY
jgi:hypothetical protein